jgi:CRP/FNR family transcriptional regulator, cyclic AMP receptor protein
MPVPRDKRYEGRYWHLLDETEQTVLQELGQPGVFQPGDVLCTEGEQATHVFVLITGWVKISSAVGSGREIVLGLRGCGDIAGELAAESAGIRTATVKAIGTVEALIVPHGRFSQFLDTHRGADHAYRTVLTRRWGEATDILLSRSVNSGPERLADYLADLAERYGTPGDSGIDITIPLSQEEIASIVGVSRATMTRALGNWRRRGIIRTSRHRLTITDITQLHHIAHKEPRSSRQPAN